MADDQDANVLGKFENILNKFSEAVAQMSAVGKDKFASVENNVAKQGGAGNATWNAIGNWLPTAENKVENNQSQFNVANSGSKDAATGKERWSMMGSGLQQMGMGFGATKNNKDGNMVAKTGSEQGQDIFKGIGSIMGAVGGPVGQVGMLFAKLAEKTLVAVDFMQKYADSLHKVNMQFAEFSGSMAAVKAQQEVRDMQLSQERGERRANSAEYLAKGKSELARSTSQGEDFMGRLNNYGGGILARLGTIINTPFEKVFTIGNKILDIMEGKKSDTTGTADVDKYGSDERRNSIPRPVRFRGRPGQ